MANPLRQLAGETAIYGLSTILARVINFLFVPFYTRLLTTESYGVVTEFMAYIAVLQVVLVLGLETGCFRFANKKGADPDSVYSGAFAAVFVVNAVFLAFVAGFSMQIASWLGYSGYENCILYVGGILFLDCVTAILFARFRQEHKALKFAVFKTVKILTETASNLLLFFLLPPLCAGRAASLGVPAGSLGSSDMFILRFVSPVPDFSYVIFAIFISSVVCALLFIPELFRLRFRFDGALLRKMLLYSLPLMVASLPGIVNDFLDRLLFRYLDTGSEVWQSSLGVFQAGVKLAVIMSLFIQMFRFAAEPFFFQRAADKDSRKLYADVMEYFTAFCGLVFLGVTLYIDVISLVLGRDFREGVSVVPVMLLSYMLLGMHFNVSIWYKLSGKTSVAVWITLAGLLVTCAVDVTFMPRYSYHAAAWGHLASYAVMLAVSVLLGRRSYPIPYRWSRIAAVFLCMGVVYAVARLSEALFFPVADFSSNWPGMVGRLGVNTVLILVYASLMWLMLRRGTGFGKRRP